MRINELMENPLDLIQMRDHFFALAEKHGVYIPDDVADFFDDILDAEGYGEE